MRRTLGGKDSLMRPILLDLFCGGGGCSVGYHRAGFDVVGVDIKPQPHYPFEFHQADALEFCYLYGAKFWAIHASPPCQKYSIARNLKTARTDHPDLIEDTRKALVETGRPYVIENVPGAPLVNPLMLCGSMFGLGVIRHRLFESSPEFYYAPASCRHGDVLPMWWKSRRRALAQGKRFEYITVAGKSFLMHEAKAAMGIDWMTRDEITQAIPPAYTEYIGRLLLAALPSNNGLQPTPTSGSLGES
jgi:DNA (cytosine-5)-methyltransferase 1